MLAALVLLCRDRPRLGLAVLGAGALTKGFPLVVVPVALAWLLARGERRAAAEGAAALVATILVIGGAATALSADGFADSLQYHLDRPAQVESSPAVVLTGLEAIGEGHALTEESFGSAGVRHPDSELVLGLFTALLAGALVLVVGAVTVRRPPGTRGAGSRLARRGGRVRRARKGVLAPVHDLGRPAHGPRLRVAYVPALRDLARRAPAHAARLPVPLRRPRRGGPLGQRDRRAAQRGAPRRGRAWSCAQLVSPSREAAGPRWPDRFRRPRPAPR